MDSSHVDIQVIERIVREVLADLGRVSPIASEAPGQQSASRTHAGEGKQSTDDVTSANGGTTLPRLARIHSPRDGELTLPNKVITLATLENRLTGVRQIVVPPGAIITPAVRDLLAEKAIKVFFGIGPKSTEVPAKANNETGTPEGASLVILLVTRRVSTEQLENLLRPEGITAAYESLDCLVRASDRVAEVCRSGNLAVVLTRHVSMEVCVANRHKGVRAVAGRWGMDIAAETASVGANVLVADVTAGLFALKRMITAFVRASHVCPDNLRERLELS